MFTELSPEACMHFCSQNISLEYYIKINKKIISCYLAHAIRGGSQKSKGSKQSKIDLTKEIIMFN